MSARLGNLVANKPFLAFVVNLKFDYASQKAIKNW